MQTLKAFSWLRLGKKSAEWLGLLAIAIAAQQIPYQKEKTKVQEWRLWN